MTADGSLPDRSCFSVNKYIGETEKNLHQLFARAEGLDVILLLDEEDPKSASSINLIPGAIGWVSISI